MKTYKSTRVVKGCAIKSSDIVSRTVTTEDDEVHHPVLANSWGTDFWSAGAPFPGHYFIDYGGGYFGWTPAEVFLKEYQTIEEISESAD